MAKMKGYADFDEYLQAQRPKNQAIIRALRGFVKRAQPGLSESVRVLRHFFVDRSHSGSSFWEVNPGDRPA
ncbi:MAG TPA: hypothetical protein VFC25_07020 [Verrucomicrobiae bacterium]|nr:hypothetical protein [Verrucomicrobiae bacterium]